MAGALITAARASDPVVCEIAGHTLGVQFYFGGMPPVVSGMRPADPVAAAVGPWTMRPIEDADVVPPLAGALADANPCVRNLSSRLLGRTRHPDAADALCGLAWRVPDASLARARMAAAGLDVSEPRSGRKPGTTVFSLRPPTHGVPTLVLAG